VDQQAPGFCAQKSSNCCASEPAGGGESAVGLSVLGAVVPPLPEESLVPLVLSVVPPVPVLAVPVPVLVPVPVPVDPDWSLGAVVASGVAVPLGVGVAVASPLALESLSVLESDGIETSGVPGTSS
jgi:hypothetical protein